MEVNSKNVNKNLLCLFIIYLNQLEPKASVCEDTKRAVLEQNRNANFVLSYIKCLKKKN